MALLEGMCWFPYWRLDMVDGSIWSYVATGRWLLSNKPLSMSDIPLSPYSMAKDDGGGVGWNVMGSEIANGQPHKFDDMVGSHSHLR